MADYESDLGRLEAEFAGLESVLGVLEGVTGAFRRELDGAGDSMKEAGREAGGLSRSVGSSIRRAFEAAAANAKDNCPISRALAGNVELSVMATLEEDH